MKKILLVLSIMACGIKPIPPVGCFDEDAVCACDTEGNCKWLWVCDDK